MARVPGPEATRVYAAAERFVSRALRRNGSVFSSRRLWGPDVIDDLRARLAVRGTDGGFDERWADVLHGAPDATVELAAEACYVHVLFASDLAPATKRRLVAGTLERSTDPPRVPPALDAALEGGLAGTGVAFKTRRLSQLRFLLDASRAWKQQRPGDRDTLLADPSAFRAFLDGVPCSGAGAQREILAHLVHPDAFEPIPSVRVKQRILNACAVQDPDADAALHSLRSRLEADHGAGFAFVDVLDVR